MSNTGQAILQVAGYAATAVTGSPLFYMAATVASNILFPTELPDVHGARLSDLQVQDASYGVAIPKTYGTTRIAGNLIWTNGIKETAHANTTGGKGGGPSQTTYTYTYSCTFAVGLCQGEISSIGKIWANGKEISPSKTAVYTGTESQLPDPTIEAIEGAGNAPAYRGLAYVVFQDFQLADYGNRIPNFEFEIIQSTTSLSDIVTDICANAGILSSDVDTTALTDTVDGYVIANDGTGRAAIEPLMQAYHFDAAEIDDKLVFVPMGGSSATSILEDELSAHVTGQTAEQPFPTETKAKAELPCRIIISFKDPSMDYLINGQGVSRTMTVSEHKITIETPVVMDSTTAMQLADTIMNHAWITRFSHTIKVSRKYAFLTPTDIITVTMNDGSSHTLKILAIERSAAGVLTLECVNESASIYSSAAVAVDGDWVPQTITSIPSVYAEMLNVPLLRDQDDSSGMYWAVYSGGNGFKGVTLYRSSDDVTYAKIAELGSEATVGHATTTMPDGDPAIIDRGSKLSIEIDSFGSGATLSSITESQMLDGNNYALLGTEGAWEVIQFQNATLTGSNPSTYDLDTFTRGRLGTEHNTGNHTGSDTFILLDQNTLSRIDLALDSIGVTYYWKVVHWGSSIDDAVSFQIANSGINLKPFSPVNIHGARDSSGNITITWNRRTRYGGEWKDYTDAPLNELVEAYEVDIMNGGAVVRTISTTSTTAYYSAAEQQADFGSAQASLTVRIYQMSDKVGRGIKGEKTI